ncbi:hypothetical protein ZHAS_00012499 [Anopheles sinensis]|uniref:Uncharacterized protein n=1 Tax=Anopheles sinensis TaxID=74873 RepID=A0A084W322_ANOSI|nr:hypothetical protein ZHAS_00012499 [Anopheles sinensis]
MRHDLAGGGRFSGAPRLDDDDDRKTPWAAVRVPSIICWHAGEKIPVATVILPGTDGIYVRPLARV